LPREFFVEYTADIFNKDAIPAAIEVRYLLEELLLGAPVEISSSRLDGWVR
jgi:hypothetical protein